MQGMQELFFCELEAPGGISTQWTPNSYDKVNLTSLFGYHIQWKKEFVSP